MYAQSLQQAGLTQDQALIYEVLLKNGPLKASKVHQKTPLKRGWVYKLLEDLSKMGLVEKAEEPGKVAVFSPAHPLLLRNLAETKERQAKDAQVALTDVLPQLTSDYQLALHKPGVQFFEGIEGIKKVYEDTLVEKSTIYAILSPAAPHPEIHEWLTKNYVKRRAKMGTKAYVIAATDTQAEEYKKTDDAQLRQTVLVSKDSFPIATEIDLYGGNKVAHILFRENELIAFVIQSEAVYQSMFSYFKLAWQGATGKSFQLNSVSTPPSAISSTSPVPEPRV